MTEIEKKAQELTDAIAAANETKAAMEKLKASLEAKMEGMVDVEKVQELKTSIENIDKSIENLKASIDMIKESKQDGKTVEQRLEDILNSTEFKQAVSDTLNKKRSSSGVFEVKIATTDLTFPINRTATSTQIYGATPYVNRFLTSTGSAIVVPQDKSRASWFDGSYTSNVGYVEELTASATADAGTIVEKTRELAKIAAKMPYSAEMATDASYALNWFRTKGSQYLLNKVDELLFAGEGNDATKPKEIYGIKTQGSTAFNATTAGLATAIDNANIADLISAAMTQIKVGTNDQFAADRVFLHPSVVAKLRALKNTQADYLNILPNGAMLIHGLMIEETSKITASEMLVSDTRTWQLHQKRALELEVERVASTDSYVLYLRWKGQFIVPTNDKLGNIYVADIDTAITAITKPAP